MMVQLRRIKVWSAPDSTFGVGRFSCKLDAEDYNDASPIVVCQVLEQHFLTRDPVKDGMVINTVQELMLRLECFPPLDLTELSDEAYVCECGRHLAYIGDRPVALCQILQLPEDVQL